MLALDLRFSGFVLGLTRIEMPFWIYWVACGLATFVLISQRIFWFGLIDADGKRQAGKGYAVAVLLGWLTTLVVGVCYVLFTQKLVDGSYSISDLVVFSCLNGSLEQGMFILWFLLGIYLANILKITRSNIRFILGFVSYSVYSGLIHALFWTRFLPDHIPAGAIIVIALLSMSLAWMWLLWRYRAILSIVIMHIVVDFITVGHLHFHWFDLTGFSLG